MSLPPRMVGPLRHLVVAVIGCWLGLGLALGSAQTARADATPADVVASHIDAVGEWQYRGGAVGTPPSDMPETCSAECEALWAQEHAAATDYTDGAARSGAIADNFASRAALGLVDAWKVIPKGQLITGLLGAGWLGWEIGTALRPLLYGFGVPGLQDNGTGIKVNGWYAVSRGTVILSGGSGWTITAPADGFYASLSKWSWSEWPCPSAPSPDLPLPSITGPEGVHAVWLTHEEAAGTAPCRDEYFHTTYPPITDHHVVLFTPLAPTPPIELPAPSEIDGSPATDEDEHFRGLGVMGPLGAWGPWANGISSKLTSDQQLAIAHALYPKLYADPTTKLQEDHRCDYASPLFYTANGQNDTPAAFDVQDPTPYAVTTQWRPPGEENAPSPSLRWGAATWRETYRDSWFGWGYRHIAAGHGWTAADIADTRATLLAPERAQQGRSPTSMDYFGPSYVHDGIDCQRVVVVQFAATGSDPAPKGIITSYAQPYVPAGPPTP
jgi:hypothetical protein